MEWKYIEDIPLIPVEIINPYNSSKSTYLGSLIPKKKEMGFFHTEMDIPEKEIDELLEDEISQWKCSFIIF